MKLTHQMASTSSYPASTKLKLKIQSNQDKNQSGSNNNNNNNSSSNHDQNSGLANYLQGYDRELDSDQDEPIGFEEQFILKMPNGPECQRLRELVEGRKEINSDQEKIFFKFKDSRRGIFNIGNKMFGMKLVDLPCIIEAQKTFDNKHLFKIADICQMILVEDTPITDESTVTQGNFNIEDFIYPHGLTPPLHHVRKRRFRKRLNKRTIETVERAVERLLEEDSRADQVIIDIVDNARDLSDSEGEDYQPPQSATVGFGNMPPSKIVYNKTRPATSLSKRRGSSQTLDSSQAEYRRKESRSHVHDEADDSTQTITFETPMGDSVGAPTPAGEEFEERAEINYDDDEGSIDSDLAAEIEAGLLEGAAAEERAAAGLTGPEDADDDDEDSEDLFGDGANEEDEEEEEEEDDDDDEEETNEMVEDKQRIRLLQGELKDLESAINRKKTEISKAANVILRKRFEEALKKLNIELESKKNQLNSTQLNLQNAVQERKSQKERRDEQDRLDDGAAIAKLTGTSQTNQISSPHSRDGVDPDDVGQDGQQHQADEDDDDESRSIHPSSPFNSRIPVTHALREAATLLGSDDGDNRRNTSEINKPTLLQSRANQAIDKSTSDALMDMDSQY